MPDKKYIGLQKKLARVQSELAIANAKLAEMQDELNDIVRIDCDGDEDVLSDLIDSIAHSGNLDSAWGEQIAPKTVWEQFLTDVTTSVIDDRLLRAVVGDTLTINLGEEYGDVEFYVANLPKGYHDTYGVFIHGAVFVSKGVLCKQYQAPGVENLYSPIVNTHGDDNICIVVSALSKSEMGFYEDGDEYGNPSDELQLFKIRPSLRVAKKDGVGVPYWLETSYKAKGKGDDCSENYAIDGNGKLIHVNDDAYLPVRLAIHLEPYRS